jgi:hypothetical protein
MYTGGMPCSTHAFVQRVGIELYSKGSFLFSGLFFFQYTSSRKRMFWARARWSPYAFGRTKASRASIEPRHCLSPTITIGGLFAHVVSYYRAHVPSRIRNSILVFKAEHPPQQLRNRCQQRVNLLRNVPKGSPWVVQTTSGVSHVDFPL